MLEITEIIPKHSSGLGLSISLRVRLVGEMEKWEDGRDFNFLLCAWLESGEMEGWKTLLFG